MNYITIMLRIGTDCSVIEAPVQALLQMGTIYLLTVIEIAKVSSRVLMLMNLLKLKIIRIINL